MTMYDHVEVNENGYLLTVLAEGIRTYACADRGALDALILRLTDRRADSFPQDHRGLPSIVSIRIAHPVHIYTSRA